MTGWQTTRELLGTASARVTQDGVGPEGQSLAGWRHRHVAHLRQVPRPRRLCPLPPSRAGTTGGDGSLGRGQTRGGDLQRATAPAGPALVWGPEALAAVGTVQTHRGLAFLSARRPFHVELGVRLPQPLPGRAPGSPSPHASIPTTRDRWRWELSPLEASFQGAQATCLPVSQGHSPKVPIAASAAQTPVGGPRPHVLPPRRLSVEPGPPPRGQQPSQSTCDA